MIAAFTVVAYAPGPANVAVSLLAMGQGRRAGLNVAFGLVLGLATWGVAAVLGLGAMLATSEAAMTAMRLVGGIYLIWLAVTALRGSRRPEAGRLSVRRPFRAGLLFNLSNPKVVLAWLAALAMGLGAQAGAGTVAMATAACAAIGLSNYLFWALLMSRNLSRRFYLRARRRVEAGTAALFGLAGVELIRQATAR